jgi:hypothetical protein
VRAYYYQKDPGDLSVTSGLALNEESGQPWVEGDKVPQFAAIGAGIDVIDTYEDKKWWLPFVRSGVMSELEKFHRHMVLFNLDLVSVANIQLLASLMLRIRPTYTRTMLVGAQDIQDDLDIDDEIGAEVQLNVLDSMDGRYGYHYDDYNGDGTASCEYDDAHTKYDGMIDTIIDGITFECTISWAGGIITDDLPFTYDGEVIDVDGAETGTPGDTFSPVYDMDLAAGTYISTIVVKEQTGVLP